MTLEANVRLLIANMLGLEPWAQLLKRHGVTAATDLFTPVTVDRTLEGFTDFCQPQAPLVQAGDPACSLLYHCLASPAVQPAGLPGSAYPSLEQIDLVENYVYSLVKMTEKERKQLVPAVFAYEYREASGTPHQRHADFVFSRIGIARVGNAPALYDPVRRCHAHAAEAAHEVRALPARYAAFLCERVQGTAMEGRRLGAIQFGDSDRTFLVPVVKLFTGQKLGEFEFSKVQLTSFHLTDRLRRLFNIGKLPNIGQADLDKPPFVRTSRNGGLQIDLTDLGASMLVSSSAQPLVREVLVSAGNSAGQVLRGTTQVPPKGKGIDAYNENRRYSTLRVGQDLFSAGFDYIASELTGAAAGARVFLSPRNCPEFVNMRHRQTSSAATVEDLNLSIPDPIHFQQTLDQGNYTIALYMDDICDGFVGASIWDMQNLNFTAAPAFSVITAPDFFPCIDSLDISSFADHFKDGGPSPLCEGRLRANTRMRDPDTDAAVFNRDDTVAAAVSGPARGTAGAAAKTLTMVPVTTALTDGASNVFAPGWDVTYGRDGVFSSPYYHTAGLGSPFVEDAKLCAAANGMWAAASPDASRTFNPTRTPTAIPLTDAELGLHPDSPGAAAEGAFRGWDGEYGPFFSLHKGALAVNYADILRADYVSNALRNLLRFDLLRAVTTNEMVTRLRAFEAALQHLDGTSAKVSDSSRWLVAFRRIEDWAHFTFNDLLPGGAVDRYSALIGQTVRWAGSAGYVFGFAPRVVDAVPIPGSGRLLAPLTASVSFVIWRQTDGAIVSAEAAP